MYKIFYAKNTLSPFGLAEESNTGKEGPANKIGVSKRIYFFIKKDISNIFKSDIFSFVQKKKAIYLVKKYFFRER